MQSLEVPRTQTTPLRGGWPVGKKEPRRACRSLGPKTFGSIAAVPLRVSPAPPVSFYWYVFHSSTAQLITCVEVVFLVEGSPDLASSFLYDRSNAVLPIR